MDLTQLLGVAAVLGASVGAGIVAHELAHAAALRLFGVGFEVAWLPGRDETGLLRSLFAGKLAAVTPRADPDARPTLALRAAAMAPLLLVAPLALVPLGVLPDPFLAEDPYLAAAVVGWMACGLPSPQDFSVLWHAEDALAEHAAEA